MSYTNTETITQLEQPATLRQVLQTYDIHQSGGDTPQRSGWSLEAPLQPSQRADWESDHRRVPPYRATDRFHRVSDRRLGRTSGETVIIVMMFSGSYALAVRSASPSMNAAY